MNDSSDLDSLAATHERNREQRLAQIKRWAEYIKSTPSEEWGPQLNSLVDSQLDAARKATLSADQYRRIEQASQSRRDDE